MKDEFFALCITRTCGSGGTEIGRMLSATLGIDLYDRKLLQLASEDSGINETIFAKADQDTKRHCSIRFLKPCTAGRSSLLKAETFSRTVTCLNTRPRYFVGF